MNERHDEQKENIKNQVNTNKNRTHNEAKLGSQNRSVDRFGVHENNKLLDRFNELRKQKNNKKNLEDKENIRNKIDATKSRNLQRSGNAQYVPNYGGSLGESNSSSENSYSDNSGNGNSARRTSNGVSNTLNSAKNLKNGAQKTGDAAKISAEGATKKVSETGVEALGKGAQTATKGVQAANKGLKNATQGAKNASNALKGSTNAGKTLNGVANTAGTVSKALVEVASKIMTFLASVFGVPLLVTAGIVALIIFIIVLIHIIISSFGMKFGIDGSNIEEFLREANVETIEGMTREEVEDLLGGYACKLTWWDRVRNFFGFPDLEEPCVIWHVIMNELDDREIKGDTQTRHGRKVTVKTQDELAPGYFFATSYYAFDTQNLDENGDLYIPLVESGHTKYNDDKVELFTEIVTDLDAIATLINSKKLDTCTGTDMYGNPTGCEPIYTMEELMELLDKYIFFEDHHNDDSRHGSGPYTDEYGYEWGFPYWLYQYIIVYYDEDDNPVWDWACVQQVPESYYTDELKFKLYLRYGENVVAEYERDKNWNLQWQMTSGQCKSWSGWTKWANGDIEEFGTVSLKEPPSLEKYNKKANPDSTGNDNAKITLESGATFGYDSGFIYKTYPRYDENYITVPRDYDYKIDKEIEKIIETIDSRQDYTNYFLGYESYVAQYIAGINNGSYSYNSGAVCSYEFDGTQINNIMVRLLDNNANPIEGQELITFEDYILGVVNAETAGYPAEAQRAEAIAARTYALNRTKVMPHATLVQENGQWILSIKSSTADQTYCDPTKNCYYNCPGYSGATYAEGTQPSSCTSANLWKTPLSSEALGTLKTNVNAVNGMILVDSTGKTVNTSYNSTDHHNWAEMANGTWNGGTGTDEEKMDYIEILREKYGSQYQVTSPDCSYGATGEWANWLQKNSEWASINLGSSSQTLGDAGCFLTCHAMVIAAGAKNILIPNFNPGTFAKYIQYRGAFDGANLISSVAMNLAVGAGNWESRAIDLSGSYNAKVAQVAGLLEDGYYVILKVQTKNIGGKTSDHYVVVTGISGSTIYMADPATTETVVLDKYFENGITWVKGIKFK